MSERNRPDVNPLATPNRVAFAGDWHAHAGWAHIAIAHAHAHDADVIVHTGDFGYRFERAYLNALDKQLAVGRTPLLFVDGNHEDHKWLAQQPVDDRGLRRLSDWVWHLPRGFRWTWHGIRFLALGGAHSVDAIWRRTHGHLWQREESLTDADKARATAGGPADVLISHDCPAGVDIPGLTPDEFPLIEVLQAERHREGLRDVVNTVRPRVIFHGHYHVRYTRTPDLGYGPVHVFGLDANGSSLPDNLMVFDLHSLDALRQPIAEEVA